MRRAFSEPIREADMNVAGGKYTVPLTRNTGGSAYNGRDYSGYFTMDSTNTYSSGIYILHLGMFTKINKNVCTAF